MSLNGQFFNPAYAGEGFYLTEQNGRLIGAFFTFDGGGAATWYVFDCNRTGDTYSGQVTQAEGGSMGSPLNSQHAYQVPVGSIIFVKDVGWSFEATIKGTTFGYALTKLFPVDEAEPVTVEHKLGNEWMGLGVPVTGTIQGVKSADLSGKKLVREYRITGATLLTTYAFNLDSAFNLNPSVEVSGGDGEIIARLYVGPSSASFPGVTKHAGFKVEDATHGVLIEVLAQVAGQ